MILMKVTYHRETFQLILVFLPKSSVHLIMLAVLKLTERGHREEIIPSVSAQQDWLLPVGWVWAMQVINIHRIQLSLSVFDQV